MCQALLFCFNVKFTQHKINRLKVNDSVAFSIVQPPPLSACKALASPQIKPWTQDDERGLEMARIVVMVVQLCECT